MYGETTYTCVSCQQATGLSPHVRGNPRSMPTGRSLPGSIPACTGKPSFAGLVTGFAGVYPRMYGETPRLRLLAASVGGLSPHVRGNPLRLAPAQAAAGSIPACTGKPESTGTMLALPAVYPRMYGETIAKRLEARYERGLSPHVRGNHAWMRQAIGTNGSIPACTGKPPPRPFHTSPSMVYPRMYGETRRENNHLHNQAGLSPHVRGNP